MSHLGVDISIMFHYILTEKGGSCTVQELADGLGINPGLILEFVIKGGSEAAQIRHVEATLPDKVMLMLSFEMLEVFFFI